MRSLLSVKAEKSGDLERTAITLSKRQVTRTDEPTAGHRGMLIELYSDFDAENHEIKPMIAQVAQAADLYGFHPNITVFTGNEESHTWHTTLYSMRHSCVNFAALTLCTLFFACKAAKVADEAPGTLDKRMVRKIAITIGSTTYLSVALLVYSVGSRWISMSFRLALVVSFLLHIYRNIPLYAIEYTFRCIFFAVDLIAEQPQAVAGKATLPP